MRLVVLAAKLWERLFPQVIYAPTLDRGGPLSTYYDEEDGPMVFDEWEDDDSYDDCDGGTSDKCCSEGDCVREAEWT